MRMAKDTLASLRAEIDRIDDAIIDLLAERLGIVERVIAVKRGNQIPALIESRVDEVLCHVRSRAKAKGLAPDLAEIVWRGIINWTIRFEDGKLRAKNQGDAPLKQKAVGAGSD